MLKCCREMISSKWLSGLLLSISPCGWQCSVKKHFQTVNVSLLAANLITDWDLRVAWVGESITVKHHVCFYCCQSYAIVCCRKCTLIWEVCVVLPYRPLLTKMKPNLLFIVMDYRQVSRLGEEILTPWRQRMEISFCMKIQSPRMLSELTRSNFYHAACLTF